MFTSEPKIPYAQPGEKRGARITADAINAPLEEIAAIKRHLAYNGTDPGTLPIGIFPVRVEKDGGSDGTSSAAASWTYTVRDFEGQKIGTTITLSRPRPNGKMTYQSGTNGIGLALYVPDATTPSHEQLILWDAGEVPNTGACT